MIHFSRCHVYNTTRYVCPTSRMTCRTYSTQVVQSSSVRKRTLYSFSVPQQPLQFRHRTRTACICPGSRVHTVSECGRTGFSPSGRNDRHQRVDRGSCFAPPFLQTAAVTMLLQFGEDPENTTSLQPHENTYQLLGALCSILRDYQDPVLQSAEHYHQDLMTCIDSSLYYRTVSIAIPHLVL